MSVPEEGKAQISRMIRQLTVEAPVTHIQLKVPEFMEEAVDSWFCIVEANFETSRITRSNTKFFNTLANLPTSVVKRLPKTVLQTREYESLKESVIGVYERSKPELLDKLLQKNSISGRPSIFLHELMATAERIDVGDDIVRHKFLDAVPDSIRTVLASQKSLTLLQLGQLAYDLTPYVQF